MDKPHDLLPFEQFADPQEVEARFARTWRRNNITTFPLWGWALTGISDTHFPVYAALKDGNYAKVIGVNGRYFLIEGYENWGQVRMLESFNVDDVRQRRSYTWKIPLLILAFCLVAKLVGASAQKFGEIAFFTTLARIAGFYIAFVTIRSLWRAITLRRFYNLPSYIPPDPVSTRPETPRCDPLGPITGTHTI